MAANEESHDMLTGTLRVALILAAASSVTSHQSGGAAATLSTTLNPVLKLDVVVEGNVTTKVPASYRI